MPMCAFHHAFRGRPSIFLMDVLFQRTAVDADADRDMTALASPHDSLHILTLSDIAWIDADLIDPCVQRCQGKPIVKMDIGDQRYGNCFLDVPQRFGILHIHDGHANQLTSGLLQPANLSNGRFCILGRCIAHRLDDDAALCADLYSAHMDGSGLFSFHVFTCLPALIITLHAH